MRMRRSVAIAVAILAAATGLASVADASFHLLPQQKLLDQGCNAAVTPIEKMLNKAWATQIVTVQTQVRVLRPGRLAGDIAFNPSGTFLNVAADHTTRGTQGFGCGYSVAGNQTGPSSGGLGEGMGIPKKHVVALVRETFSKPGRYALTFTLNAKGRRILAHLGAQERAWRKHHPPGRPSPMITWGIGLHYLAGG